MDYSDNVFNTFLGLDSVIYLTVNGTVRELQLRPKDQVCLMKTRSQRCNQSEDLLKKIVCSFISRRQLQHSRWSSWAALRTIRKHQQLYSNRGCISLISQDLDKHRNCPHMDVKFESYLLTIISVTSDQRSGTIGYVSPKTYIWYAGHRQMFHPGAVSASNSIRYISLYFLRFCIWIKQIKWKRVKITLHCNIVTLQSKNKNNDFKAEVKFTKLKMKIIKKHRLIE